jgi:nucleotide-binding universal stress UspA family protein
MLFRRVLIALDGSALAAHALDVGMGLVRALGAEAGLVHAVDPKLAFAPEAGVPAQTLMEELRRDGHAILAGAASRAGGAPPWQFLREGDPAHEIIAAAREWDADLIVLGSHGRSGLARVMLGSTAESVVRHAPCPVVVVRRGDSKEA